MAKSRNIGDNDQKPHRPSWFGIVTTVLAKVVVAGVIWIIEHHKDLW